MIRAQLWTSRRRRSQIASDRSRVIDMVSALSTVGVCAQAIITTVSGSSIRRRSAQNSATSTASGARLDLVQLYARADGARQDRRRVARSTPLFRRLLTTTSAGAHRQLGRRTSWASPRSLKSIENAMRNYGRRRARGRERHIFRWQREAARRPRWLARTRRRVHIASIRSGGAQRRGSGSARLHRCAPGRRRTSRAARSPKRLHHSLGILP